MRLLFLPHHESLTLYFTTSYNCSPKPHTHNKISFYVKYWSSRLDAVETGARHVNVRKRETKSSAPVQRKGVACSRQRKRRGFLADTAKLCLRMDSFLIKIDGFVTISCMFSEAPFVVYIMLLLDHSSFSLMILDLLLLYSIMLCMKKKTPTHAQFSSSSTHRAKK